jgi:hypothetical protein
MTNIAIENGPVEIVDLPTQNGDFPCYVSLPEGMFNWVYRIKIHCPF